MALISEIEDSSVGPGAMICLPNDDFNSSEVISAPTGDFSGHSGDRDMELLPAAASNLQ